MSKKSGAERRKARRHLRSHYSVPQIAAAVAEDLADKRTQIAEHRRHAKTDPNWEFDAEIAVASRRQRIVQPSRTHEAARLAGILDP